MRRIQNGLQDHVTYNSWIMVCEFMNTYEGFLSRPKEAVRLSVLDLHRCKMLKVV